MLAITGGKGGCGKTTVALGLGTALVERGRRPLLVDADVGMPDLHIRAGVDREPGLPALETGGPPERVTHPSTDLPGVDVLPAGTTTACPLEALRSLSNLSRPVVLDCPAGAGPDASTPLRAADACVIVTTTDPESRQDATKTAAMADALGVPVVATVVRSTGPAGKSDARGDVAPDDRKGPLGPHRDVPTVAVPTVEGQPLADCRITERLATIVRAIWGDDNARPETRWGTSRVSCR